jgi:hypothetical protein
VFTLELDKRRELSNSLLPQIERARHLETTVCAALSNQVARGIAQFSLIFLTRPHSRRRSYDRVEVSTAPAVLAQPTFPPPATRAPKTPRLCAPKSTSKPMCRKPFRPNRLWMLKTKSRPCPVGLGPVGVRGGRLLYFMAAVADEVLPAWFAST